MDNAGNRKEMPLGSYLGTVGVFNFLLGRLVLRKKPTTLNIPDMILLGIAVHKLSRIITKDVVTTPFRVPFTRFQEFLGYGEVQEEAMGKGLRQTLGELISCNYCADPWVALGFLYALERYPENTRFLLKFFSSAAIADFLHVIFETIRTRENVLTLREEKLEQQQKRHGAGFARTRSESQVRFLARRARGRRAA